MKPVLIFSLVLFLFQFANAQEITFSSISKKDSLELLNEWNKLSKNISNKNYNELVNQSYFHVKNYLDDEKVDNARKFWRIFYKFKIDESIKSKKINIYKLKYDYLKPIQFYSNYFNSINSYEVAITITDSNVLEKGKEGFQLFFRFLKTKFGYKLYQLYTIP